MAFPINDRLPVPMGTDPQAVRARVEAMEKLLERMFVIPGINKPVGLDVILDLVPGIGDIAGAVLGLHAVPVRPGDGNAALPVCDGQRF